MNTTAGLTVLKHISPENRAPALVFPEAMVSYAELAARVDQLTQRLGAERKLIGLEAQVSADFVVVYLAALKAGHAVALLPSGDPAAAEMFCADFMPDISFGLHEGQWRMTAHEGPSRGKLHADLAVMLATSGTEGKPRWVKLSRQNIDANAQSIAQYLRLTARDRVAHALPFHYSYGLSVLNSHLVAGGSLAFCGESVISPDFLPHAGSLGCTGFSGVPYSYELLERIGFREKLWPALRYMTVAGGRLPPELVRLYAETLARRGGQFFAMYGQTEATARMAYVPPELAASQADCIGIAIPGGQLRILDEHGRNIAKPGVSGELFYSGPNVMMGYATRRDDLGHGPEIGELATGDIAVRTPDGLFRLEGRARRFSKIAGLRIGHEAVEWALRAQGIACAVTGTDDTITAHVEAGDARDIEGLAAKAGGIPARHVRVQRHESLPRLSSGKIDYAALAETGSTAAGEAATSLLADFQAALYPKPVGLQDSFESLEGDSLAYVQASLAVENRLGFLPDGWEAMPLGRLQALAAGKPGTAPARTQKIESHIALRAAAILLIVVHHATLWPIPGGAAALMLLVGFGFARFHREALFEGRTPSFLLPMLRNLLPYFVIVLGFALAWQTIPWASLLLAGNFGFADPAQKTMLPFQFWFVEAYVQLCLVMALAFSVPSVRGMVKARPFATALGFLFLAFSLRYLVPALYDIGLRKMFLLSYVLWFPVMGWCAYFAESRWQKCALLLAAALLCPFAAYTGGNWTGAWILYMMQFGVVAALVLRPSIRLPRLVVPGVMLISAASYHIYLFHRLVPELLGLDGRGALGIVASIGVGIISGIGAAALQKRIFARLGRRSRLKPKAA